jgi:hypothetical protein
MAKKNFIFSVILPLFTVIEPPPLLAMDPPKDREEIGFEILPAEVRLLIFKNLSLQDIIQVGQVSRDFYALSNDNEVWRGFLHQWSGVKIPERSHKESLRAHIEEISIHFHLSYRPPLDLKYAPLKEIVDHNILLKTSHQKQFQLKIPGNTRLDRQKIGSLIILPQDKPVLISLNFNNFASVYIALTHDILWNEHKKKLKEIHFNCKKVSPCYSPEFNFTYSN